MTNTTSKLLHAGFKTLPVNPTCTWPGTNWVGTGKEAKLLPCGNPTVGAGLFCAPGHIHCKYFSVCERHKQQLRKWEDS